MINSDNVKVNSVVAWFLAARPKTLTGAAVPVMIGTSMAMADNAGCIDVVPAVLCFLFAFIMQIDANFVNDYFDCLKGNDDETRLGPKRACAQGWISVCAMRKGIVFTTVLACIAGLPLVFYGGWTMIGVGALCVLFCFLYTTSLSYLGLGDLLVLVFFGIVPVSLTYFLEISSTPRGIGADVLWMSVACGMVIDTLLIVNNYRDIDNDRRAGKKTLVVRIGKRASEILYLALGFGACLIGMMVFSDNRLWAALLPLGYLFLHVSTYRRMVGINRGRELNGVLGHTARNMFVYGLLVALGQLFYM